MRKEPPKTAAEHDTVSKWRRVCGYLKRAGVARKIKRNMRKRARRKARLDLATLPW